MMNDRILSAKLETMGISSRALVWRLAQWTAWAASFHGRSELELSGVWFAKAVHLGDVIGAELPPLFEPTSDHGRGSALALKYVLTTAGPALKQPVAKLGNDHLALLECALKLCFVDVVGSGGGEMLDAIAEALRGSAAAGGLPKSFQKRIDEIVAEAGRNASKLIFDAYGEAYDFLRKQDPVVRRQDAVSTGAPNLEAQDDAASSQAERVHIPSVDLTAIPDSNAGARLLINHLAQCLSTLSSVRCNPEMQVATKAQLTLANEITTALGISLPEFAPLTGDLGKDVSDSLMYPVMEPGKTIAASLAERHGPAQGALFEAVATMFLWLLAYSPTEPKRSAEFYPRMISALARSELPSHLWGAVATIEVGLPDREAFTDMSVRLRRAIRTHLETAIGMG